MSTSTHLSDQATDPGRRPDSLPLAAAQAEQPVTLELWQTEWCPASQRVRQRLTELGVSYLNRQVPAAVEERSQLLAFTGVDSVPVLAVDGVTIAGEQQILEYLDSHFSEPQSAAAHRERAARRQAAVREAVLAQEQEQSAQPRSYTISRVTELPFAHALERVREELAGEGFGVLSEIDVQATLERKLGIEHEPYVILGACNPPLAHRALSAEPELGTLLPCNVVVYVREQQTHLAAVDPGSMLGVTGNRELEPVAAEVHARLERVLARV